RRRGFSVTSLAEINSDLLGRGLVAGRDLARDSVDLGSVGEDRALHALIDQLLIPDVIEGKDAEQESANDDECGRGSTYHGMTKMKASGFAASRRLAFGNFKFDRHCGLELSLR